MKRARKFIGIVTAPALFASAGCVIDPFPKLTNNRGMTPERMMAMAKTFERQGHPEQAKYAYYQVLAMQPQYPNAQQSLETLIAKQLKENQANPAGQPQNSGTMIATIQPPQSIGNGLVQQPNSLPPTNLLAANNSVAPAHAITTAPAVQNSTPIVGAGAPANLNTLPQTFPTQAALPQAAAPQAALPQATAPQNGGQATASVTIVNTYHGRNRNGVISATQTQRFTATPLPAQQLQNVTRIDTARRPVGNQPVANSPAQILPPAAPQIQVAAPSTIQPPATLQAPAVIEAQPVSTATPITLPPSSEIKPPEDQQVESSPAVQPTVQTPGPADFLPVPSIDLTSDVRPTNRAPWQVSNLPPIVLTPPSCVALQISYVENKTPETTEPSSADEPVNDIREEQISTDKVVPSAAPKMSSRVISGQSTIFSPTTGIVLRAKKQSNQVTSLGRLTSDADAFDGNDDFQLPTPADESTSVIDFLLKDEQGETAVPADSDQVQLDQVVCPELLPFFGEFQAEMVDQLIAQREQLQEMLVQLSIDSSLGREIRSRAIFLLGCIGPEANEATSILKHHLREETDEALRVELSETVLRIHGDDTEAVEFLLDCLGGSDQELCLAAAFAIRNARPSAVVIDRLQEHLDTHDAKLKRMLVLTLGEYGPAAAQAASKLESFVNGPDKALQEVARVALACICPAPKTNMATDSPLRLSDLKPEELK